MEKLLEALNHTKKELNVEDVYSLQIRIFGDGSGKVEFLDPDDYPVRKSSFINIENANKVVEEWSTDQRMNTLLEERRLLKERLEVINDEINKLI